MKKLILLIMLVTLALPAYAAENQPQNPEPPTKTEKAVKDAEANVTQTCWSARKCSGKVLNHRDRHNCKNSGGKSWNDNHGTCYNNL